MKTVEMQLHPFDKGEWYVACVDDVITFLMWQFKEWPSHLRIYHNSVDALNDVTPIDERGEQHLANLEGKFIVTQSPALEPLTIIALVVAGLSFATSMYTMLTAPKAQKQNAQSPNNELGRRQNAVRINGRICDNYGTNRTWPDFISVPENYYNDDGVEVQREMFVIGRGYYQILDMRDATTAIAEIADAAISVYDPWQSLLSTPQYKTGKSFDTLPNEVIKSQAITGQTLDAPDDPVLETDKVYFTNAGEIIRKDNKINFLNLGLVVNDSIILSGAQLDFLKFNVSSNVQIDLHGNLSFIAADIIDFESYQSILLGNFTVTIKAPIFDSFYDKRVNFAAEYAIDTITRTATGNNYVYVVKLLNPENNNSAWVDYLSPNITDQYATLSAASSITLQDNANDVNLTGTYEILSISESKITLDVSSNDAWQDFGADTSLQNISISIDKLTSKWVGWHTIYLSNAEQLVFNIHFPQGLFRQNSKGGTSEDWTSFQIEWQYVDINGVPQGNIRYSAKEIYGKTRVSFGRTERINLMPAYAGIRFRISRSRVSIASNVNATMNLKDVYLIKRSTKENYPDVTVIQSLSVGNDGLYAIQERKLNTKVVRKLPVDGTGPLQPTNAVDQILIDAALDPYIGRRTLNEIDVAQIKAEVAAINQYFGSNKASEFCSSIDDANLSFEEIARMIASAAFSEPARFGTKLRLRFERPQTNAVMLFNHRNKAPGTDIFSGSNRIENDYNALEVEYTSDVDDARVKILIPEGSPATNVKKISTVGIRNEAQARTRAWREWHKLVYERQRCEFQALDESSLLDRNDKILVADNTSLDTQDGEVKAINGLVLTLSQDVVFKQGEVKKIHLQLKDRTVDMIDCYAGELMNQVVLARPPLQELVVGRDRYLRTMYQVVSFADHTAEVSAFLLVEMKPTSAMLNELRCINYSDKYYSEDHKFF